MPTSISLLTTVKDVALLLLLVGFPTIIMSSTSLRWRTIAAGQARSNTAAATTTKATPASFVEDFGLPSTGIIANGQNKNGIVEPDVTVGSSSSKSTSFFFGRGSGGGGAGQRRKGNCPNQLSSRQLMSLWNCCYQNDTYCNVYTVSLLAIISSFASIRFAASHAGAVYISSTLCCIVATILVLQKHTLKRSASIRQQHKLLHRQLNYMTYERERLHRTLHRMDQTMVDLASVPKDLKLIVKTQNLDSIDRYIYLIEQHQLLREKMRTKIIQQIVQSMLSALVQCDSDENYTLNPNEIERLIRRLKHIEGIIFHEERFRQALLLEQQQGEEDEQNDSHYNNDQQQRQLPTITSIMSIIRSIVERDDEYQHPPPIFEIRK